MVVHAQPRAEATLLDHAAVLECGKAYVSLGVRRRGLVRRGAARLCLAAVAASLLAILAPASAGAKLVLGPGGWSYFGDPRAVHAGGRTFIGWAAERLAVRR